MRRRLAAAAAAIGLVLGLFVGAGSVLAQDPVARVDWTSTAPLSGEVVDGNVRIIADAAGGTFPLVEIDAPDVGTVGYAIRGQVKYADVAGQGYLEMWSYFADGGQYFSRTMAADGPMAVLSGTSDWRDFELPFYLQGTAGPDRLAINVVLPGAGTVDMSPLELVRLDADTGSAGAWLTDRAIGVAGALIGVAVGAFAVAVAWLAARRRARRFVLAAMTAAAGAGIALIVLSAIGWFTGQPLNVVLFVLVSGVVLVAAFGVSIPRTRRLYADAELRKMRAMDHA